MPTATAGWVLSDEAEVRLKREISTEQRQKNDEFRKWATLFFAIVGSVLAFVSVLSKHKQPDPCQNNYYRSDSGECVFALQKSVKPQSQQQNAPQTLSASPKKEKPSPSHH